MAGLFDRGFTGFEGGERDSCFSFSGNILVVGDGNARTGDFHLAVAVNGSAGYTQLDSLTNVGVGIPDNTAAKGIIRFLFRIRQHTSVTNMPVGGFGIETSTNYALMDINTTGNFAARVPGMRSAYSAAALALDTWYEVIVTALHSNPPAGFHTITCSVSVYNADTGALIETKSANNTNTMADLPQPTLGGNVASIRHFEYDDCTWVMGDQDEVVNVVLPTAKRVSPVYITGQGTSTDFANDWRASRNLPRDTVGPLTGQTSSTVGHTTTFLKKTAAQLGLGTIAATRIVAHLRSPAASGNDALVWNGSETTVAVPTSFPSGSTVQEAYDWSALAAATWDAAQFGVRNKRGVSLEVGKIYAEVLHDGNPPVDAVVAGVDSWKHKLGVYVGTGAFQTITGVGFAAQTILIKKVAGGGNTDGAVWLRRLGGTLSKYIDTVALTSVGVMGVTDDGFELGTSNQINEVGVTYQYLAIQDGGQDDEGAFFTCGVYVGNAVDGRDIVTPAGFQPEAVMVMGTTAMVYRSSEFVGDSALVLSADTTTANLIQALNADGFELGSSGVVNQSQVIFPYFALRRDGAGRIAAFFDFGSFTAAGAATTVSGLEFPPVFVIADRSAGSVDAAWRSSQVAGHAGLDSSPWGGGADVTTSITALTADGFSCGANLSSAGVVTHWLAFLGEGEITDPVEIEFENATVLNPLTWVEFTDSAGTMRPWAKIALPDPSTYYGGYKDDRVIRWGSVSRALSDKEGQYEGLDFSWVMADTDRLVRGMLDAESTRYLANRHATVRIIDDVSRRALLVPRTLVKGIVRDYKLPSPLHIEFVVQDILAAKFSLSNAKEQIPQRTITADDFPNAATATIGKPVPIIYGELSDLNVPTVPPGLASPIVVASVVGPAGSATYVFGFTALDNRNNQAFNFDARNDHAGETAATVVVVTNAPHFDDLSGTNYIHFDIEAPGAHHCRAYVQAGDGGFYVLDQTDEIGAPFHFYDYGQRNGVRDIDSIKWDCSPPAATNVVADTGKGLVPVINVGQRSVGGADRYELLVCGHAVKSILAVYQAGIRVSDADVAANFLIPGTAEWTAALGSAATYRDFNGRRYTVIYANVGTTKGDQAGTGEAPITLNVQGIEDVGDGSGTLITDLLLQYKHAVINWILQSYQSGAWLTAPVFPDDVTLPQVDEASFDAASAVAATRISGGYVGAFIIGADGERTTVRDLIARFNVNADVDSGFNRKCQFFVSMADESTATLDAARVVIDQTDILQGTFQPTDNVADLFNEVPAVYQKDYAGHVESGWGAEYETSDGVSITAMGETKTSPTVELHMTRHQATAEDVVQRRLLRSKEPPRVVKFTTGIGGLNIELGDVLKVTHFEGVGPNGWVENPVRVLRHETDPDQFTVTLEVLDMARLFGAAFILGDETVLPASWLTATAAQRRYGYLADEVTGEFSDGAEGKHLR